MSMKVKLMDTFAWSDPGGSAAAQMGQAILKNHRRGYSTALFSRGIHPKKSTLEPLG
jgi:hypothetical protein